MKKYLFATILFLAVPALMAQSLLWKISGKDLKAPSYLFGTIHIQDKRVFSFDTLVYQTLLSCDAYAMELLMDEITREEIESGMLMKKESLKELLTPAEYAKLDTFFAKKTGQPLLLFNKTKPFFVYSQLMQADLAKDMGDALDLYLLKMSRKAGKKAFGIEKLADQIGAIDQISLREQCDMMMKFIEDTTTESENFEELIKTYMSADLDKMLELMQDSSMPAKFNQAFLIDRNVGMTKSIVKISRQQSTFHAIGAAHLGGPDGVIALLRAKGYTVEPVPFNFRNN